MRDAVAGPEPGHRLASGLTACDRCRAKEHPPNRHDKDGVEVPELGADAGKHRREPGSFKNKEKSVIKAPDDECPFRAVPKPAQQKPPGG